MVSSSAFLIMIVWGKKFRTRTREKYYAIVARNAERDSEE